MGKACQIDGCKTKHHARNYCRKHYARYQRGGLPAVSRSKREHAPLCKVKGCKKKYHVNGYCSGHESQRIRHGKITATKIKDIEHHGLAGTREYANWAGMKARCHNKKSVDYKFYGGKGIKVCDRWRNSFKAFVEDMGERPDGMSLDRVDPFGDYEPGNCRWATTEQQSRNKRCHHVSLDREKKKKKEGNMVKNPVLDVLNSEIGRKKASIRVLEVELGRLERAKKIIVGDKPVKKTPAVKKTVKKKKGE